MGFLRNTGPNPLNNHKATKPVFNAGLLYFLYRKRCVTSLVSIAAISSVKFYVSLVYLLSCADQETFPQGVQL